MPLLESPKECNSNYYKGTCTSMFYYSTIYNSQDVPQLKNGLIWYLYTVEFYFTMKNEILSFTSKWMELENNILSEVSQAQKAKSLMFSLICRL
jgi:hypothetical protein